ncbi:MAG: hypothetical protein F7B61_05850 [Caldisphaeraceae archaeon]|nr:hypothetical protein [Caldisphaeraceae archaeon]
MVGSNTSNEDEAKILESSKSYFSSIEPSIPPILMSSAMIVAFASLLLQHAKMISLVLVAVALTLAFVGSAMEIMFLLILKRIDNIISGKKDSIVLNVIIIAVMMMLYFIIIGMPIINYYESKIIESLKSPYEKESQCTFKNPLISLFTFGFAISVFQACISINMLSVIDIAIYSIRQTPPELLRSYGY